MDTEEATINPDGSTTFSSADGENPATPDADMPPTEVPADAPFGEDSGETFDGGDAFQEKSIEDAGIDPVVYLLIGAAVLGLLFYFFVYLRQQKNNTDDDDFFGQMDVEKVR